MDSVTQAALGAVVGQSIMGRYVGRLAPVIGVVLGTLPDLDVFISFGGAVEDFTYHRGFSHSLFVHMLATPFIVWLILKSHSASRPYRNQWAITVIAILWTHALLDNFTVYGTQLLWPFTDYPFGISSVFIIDPFYTVPLLIGLLLAGMWGWQTQKAKKAAVAVLCVSSAYLSWSVIAKTWLHHNLDQALAKQEIKPEAILSTPAPFNTFLWRVIILEGDTYRVGHLALWDDPATIDFRSYLKGEDLLEEIAEQWDIERLEWFTKGFYRAAERDNQIVISDLRMGFEESYAFNFAIANKLPGGIIEAIKAVRIEDERDLKRLTLLWDRLWDSSVSLHPSSVSLPKEKLKAF
ncbi:MAG: inner membrane protein [Oleiphilaceae bacterium]|jgi:inner membrane protein